MSPSNDLAAGVTETLVEIDREILLPDGGSLRGVTKKPMVVK